MARLSLAKNAERRKKIVIVFTMWLEFCSVVNSFLSFLGTIISLHAYRPKVRSYSIDFYMKREYVRRLVHENDDTAISQLRMSRAAFFKLCEMLQHIGGLKPTRNMDIDEQVAMFLHIIAHHVKNRVISHNFKRSGETISRHFHNVLDAMVHLQDRLLRKPDPIPINSTDNRWKWFKNCLGALDGTHIKVKVPIGDKPRYRTRKGDIATNMLGVCTPDMQFVYVLPGWEGSVADGRVLRDAIRRRNGLKVPHARNVIERCFGLLKMRWGILRSPSFYSIRIYNRIIVACCLLHNYIRREMSYDPIEADADQHFETNSSLVEENPIIGIDPTDAWSHWRLDLANQMFNEWQSSRRN
ncbi:hypothetical protein PTKIN_Ptkin09bG0284500 [Pterospermum kingtungense]